MGGNMYSSQTNLAEMKRIHMYLTGSNRGLSTWLNKLRQLFPEAQHGEGKTSYYIFEPEKVWNVILQNETWKRIITNRKISDYWELSAKATPDDWYKSS
jgi:hypothetical protein